MRSGLAVSMYHHKESSAKAPQQQLLEEAKQTPKQMFSKSMQLVCNNWHSLAQIASGDQETAVPKKPCAETWGRSPQTQCPSGYSVFCAVWLPRTKTCYTEHQLGGGWLYSAQQDASVGTSQDQ